MNAHRFANLGDYLRDFMRAVNQRAAVDGNATFSIQVLDDGLKTTDVELLK